MVKSPWSITGRQNRWKSRAHAFCSSGVPLRSCWAKASDETGIDNKKRAKGAERNLRIVFLHFRQAENPVPEARFGMAGRDLLGIADAAYRSHEHTTSTAKCG